jgi:5-formyltetrahydrofolate cyclo-ligase
VELDPQKLAAQGVPFADVATWQGAMELGSLVSPFDMPAIDLVLVGCVAVSRGGGRTGKGAGFADLELGILRELGLLKAGTPIVAAVHPLQIVPDDRLPMDAHDSPLDWIITPDEVIRVESKYTQPSGIDWPAIRPEQFASIPILSALASHMNVKVERQ